MNYTALKKRVNNLIERVSELTITFSRVDTVGYEERVDPVTNTMKWYLNGVETTTPTATTYSGRCAETRTSDYFKAKGYVRQSDRTFITNGIPRLLKNEVVTIDGTDFTVYSITPVNPGGTDVLYRILARV